LQSHQQLKTVPLPPRPPQQVLSPEVFILAILIGVRWNLRVILTCISLIIKDLGHFFRCFSTIQYSSFVNSLFSSIPHFLIGLFGFLVVSL
jgi:cyanate permease